MFILEFSHAFRDFLLKLTVTIFLSHKNLEFALGDFQEQISSYEKGKDNVYILVNENKCTIFIVSKQYNLETMRTFFPTNKQENFRFNYRI